MHLIKRISGVICQLSGVSCQKAGGTKQLAVGEQDRDKKRDQELGQDVFKT